MTVLVFNNVGWVRRGFLRRNPTAFKNVGLRGEAANPTYENLR